MKKISFLLFLVFTAALLAQNPNSNPYIEVTGIAKTEIIPDEIYLDISIKERIEKGQKLTLTILEKELKATLNKIGIPENNLSISDVNAVLSKTGWWQEEVLSLANYTLKVNGASKLKKLFEYFKKMNIYQLNITKATHSNISEIRKNNRIKAIKLAKEKADYLLTAIGEQTGKPITVNEVNAKSEPSFVNANFINDYRGLTSMSKLEKYKKSIVQFEKIKITSSMYVKFLIK
ncbi:MAG: SIMPL domain-containing protein [Polaribacter sp.]|nr:SIMPL domain-containing protein [Polaribacter sp.]